MNKNLQSPTKLTEFAPLQPEEKKEGVGQFISKFFKLTKSAPEPCPPIPENKVADNISQESLPTWAIDTTPEASSVQKDAVNKVYQVDPADGRNHINVLKRISNLLALKSNNLQAYADTELKQYWMPDSVSKECYECSEKFTTFRRRHHCRVCGQIFCSQCCNQQIPGKIFGCTGDLRVCTYCCKIVLTYLQSSDVGADLTADLRTLQESLQSKYGSSSNLCFSQNLSPAASIDSIEPTATLRRKISLGYQEEKFQSGRTSNVSYLTTEEKFRALQNSTSLRNLYEEIFHPTTGIPLQTHRYRLRTYVACLLGSQLVDWLICQQKASTRVQAAAICQALLEGGYIECATDTNEFVDGFVIYKPGVISSPEPVQPNKNFEHSHQDEPSWIQYVPQESSTTDSDTEFSPNQGRITSSSSYTLDLNVTANTVYLSRPPASSHSIYSSDSEADLEKHKIECAETPEVMTSEQKEVVPESGWHNASKLREENGEEMSYNLLMQAYSQHEESLLKQLLSVNGLSMAWSEVIPSLIHDVVDVIRPDINHDAQDIDIRQHVHFKKVLGGARNDSKLIRGVVFSKNIAHKGMSTKYENPRILLLQCSIVYQRQEGRLMSLEPVLMQEHEYLRHAAARIIALQPNIVLVQRTVSRLAQDLLREQGVTLVYNVKEQVLDRLSRCTHADLVTSVDAHIGRPRLGTCKKFYLRTFSSENGVSKTLMFFDGLPLSNLGGSILLRGSSKKELVKVKKVASLFLFACYNWRLEKSFLMDAFAQPPNTKHEFFDESKESSPVDESPPDEGVQRKSSETSSIKSVSSSVKSVTSSIKSVTGSIKSVTGSIQSSKEEVKGSREDANNKIANGVERVNNKETNDKETNNKETLKESAKESNNKESAKESNNKEAAKESAKESNNKESPKESNIKESPKESNNKESAKESNNKESAKESNNKESAKESNNKETNNKNNKEPKNNKEGKNHKEPKNAKDSEKKVIVESVSDFTDPLHSYNNEVFTKRGSEKLSVAELPFSNNFRKALDDTILCISPYLVFTVPFLETEQGRKCKLRKFFPEEIYYSSQFNGHKRIKSLRDAENFEHNERNNIKSKMKPPHPFVTAKICTSVDSNEIQNLLANFRACGGRFEKKATLVLPSRDENGGYRDLGSNNLGSNNLGNRDLGRDSGPKDLGHRDSGYRDSGYRDSGYRDSGHRDPRHRDLAHRDSGHRDSGHRYSGHGDTGHRNSGNGDSGNRDSGNRDSGNRDSGNKDSGNRDSGNRDSGNKDSGNRDSGNRDSGNRDSGNRDSGNRDSGNRDTGNKESGTIGSKDGGNKDSVKDAELEKIDALDPNNHQKISVLFCSYSLESNNAPAFCVYPWVVPMDFYGINDIPLGCFLERYCFKNTYRCQSKTCETPMLRHIRRFVHNSGCVSLYLNSFENEFAEDGIVMWSWCTKCSSVSPVVLMSSDTWSFSFAKYLELRFHGNIYSRRGNPPCQHSLQHDHYQYFGYKNIVAAFKYTSIDLWEITLPPPIIEINYDIPSQQNAIIDEIKALALKGHEIYSLVLEKLSILPNELDFVTNFKQMLAKEQAIFRQKIEEVQLKLTSPTLENKELDFSESTVELQAAVWRIADSLVRIKRIIVDAVESWNGRLSEALKKKDGDKKKDKLLEQESPSSPESKPLLETQAVGDGSGAEVCEVSASSGAVAKKIKSLDHNDAHCSTLEHRLETEESKKDLFKLFKRNINSTLATQLRWSDEYAQICLRKGDDDKPPPSPRGHQRSHSDGTVLSQNDDIVDSKRDSDKKSVKSILSQLLPANTTFTPMAAPFSQQEHYMLPTGVYLPTVVYEPEPSTIIAYALNSFDYKKAFDEMSGKKLHSNEQTPSPVHKRKTQTDKEKGESNEAASGEKSGLLSFLRAKESKADLLSSSSNSLASDANQSSEQAPSTDKIEDAKKSKTLIEVNFEDSSCNFFCRIYCAERFAWLRSTVLPIGEEAYIRSLSRCVQWNARGGKSGSTFCKTTDDRFILKEMPSNEVKLFLESAPNYFAYMQKCQKTAQPTLLGKIVGIYQIIFRNNSTNATLRTNLLVMENLFYNRTVSQKFDLKGSMRNRLVNPDNQDGEIVLLDENLLKMTCNSPLYILPHSKAVLTSAIQSDTEFLSKQSVMDYSLLVGLDTENKELVLGIIDYIRTFTWDKKIETLVKKNLTLGTQGKLPTIISPEEYQKRFIQAMHRYFLEVPDPWAGLGKGLEC